MATEMEGVVAFDRLKDHYKHCIRLSASNKINPKNAFDLQLIDYMQDLVSTTGDGQMNFKIASSALDVGAKIYSNRVDCIQSEAQKVASSILMALDNQQQKATNSDDPNDSQNDGDTTTCGDGDLDQSGDLDADGQKRNNRKKRQQRKNIKTIVEDNAIDGKLDKLVLGDPFLDGLSNDYDMSCPAALICYNELVQPCCLLTIESNNNRKDYRDTDEPFGGISGEQAVTLVTKNINCAQVIRNSLHLRICPRLDGFLFNDRTTKISGLEVSFENSIALPDERVNVQKVKTAPGEHEFDPTVYGQNDYGDDHFGDADSVVDEQDDRQENLLPDLDQIGATNPTQYGYSSEQHRLMNTWAGPHAWKAMKVPKTARKEPPKSARKKIKLEQKPTDFIEDCDVEREKIGDKETRHSSDVIRRWKKPLLPQDHNLNEESIKQTILNAFMRPEDTYNCAKTPADALKDIDKDHDYIRTENNEDSMTGGCATPGSPGLGGFDEIHDDSDDDFAADPMVDNEVAIYGAPINNPLNQETDLEFAGEHLIEQPYTVAQLNIPFARIAKKMDVRRLKRVMWDLLFPPEKQLDETINNITVIENQPANDETVKSDKRTPSPSDVHLEFSNLYGELPVRVSSKMANDLSQPIAFVTLLHLANEKNLKLIPKEDLKDFIIEQDETSD